MLPRSAFVKTMQDPQVREDALKIKLELAPVAGETLERAARDAYSASPEAIAHGTAVLADTLAALSTAA